MYGYCSNKALYSASFSFTIFTGPAAVAWQVLQNRLCPSFPLPRCFLELDLYFFLNFGVVLETEMTLCMTEPIFFIKTLFCPNWENGSKLGQNRVNLLKKIVFNFYWNCYVRKIYVICCVPIHDLRLVKILFLRQGPKCFLPIRLQYF